MKILIILQLLFMNFSYAYYHDQDGLEGESKVEKPKNSTEPLVNTYCINAEGTQSSKTEKIVFSENFTCTIGRTPQFFYEAWKDQDASLSALELKPRMAEKELNFYEMNMALVLAKSKGDKNFQKCAYEAKTSPDYKVCEELKIYKSDPDFYHIMRKNVSLYGEGLYLKNNPSSGPVQEKKSVVTNEEADATQVVIAQKNAVVDNKNYVNKSKNVVNNAKQFLKNKYAVENKNNLVVDQKTLVISQTTVVDPNKKEEVVVDPNKKEEVVVDPNKKEEVVVDPNKKEEVVVDPNKKDDVNCTDELKKEMAALLSKDTNNIIGLQYELTVLKMAATTVGNQTKTLESLIRKQSKEIEAMDNGIIDKMNAMYKKHGLKEDAAAITQLLKEKSTSANYYDKHKRFFNQDSSAFLLAYQNINQDSGIKDADISVLWLMDKVTEKAKADHGEFSAEHNLTNLSTKVAQYTGGINPKKALSKEKLDELVKGKKEILDQEFLAIIKGFKETNPACYINLFGEGDPEAECNINLVEATFSQLLAVNSKIEAKDLISVDNKWNKPRFNIAAYVGSSEPVKVDETPVVVDEKPVVIKTEPIVVEHKEVVNPDDEEEVPLIPLVITTPTSVTNSAEDLNPPPK